MPEDSMSCKDNFIVNDLVLRIDNIDNRKEELVTLLSNASFSISSAELFPKVYKIGDHIALKREVVVATNELIANSIIVPKMVIPHGITCEIKCIYSDSIECLFNFVGEARAIDLINRCECTHRYSVDLLTLPKVYFL